MSRNIFKWILAVKISLTINLLIPQFKYLKLIDSSYFHLHFFSCLFWYLIFVGWERRFYLGQKKKVKFMNKSHQWEPIKTARITSGFKQDVIKLIIIHYHTDQKKLELTSTYPRVLCWFGTWHHPFLSLWLFLMGSSGQNSLPNNSIPWHLM